jgi:hypothetical protein
MRTLSMSPALVAAISAAIWVVISALTAGPPAFAIVGGVLCGMVVFVIGHTIRRASLHL